MNYRKLPYSERKKIAKRMADDNSAYTDKFIPQLPLDDKHGLFEVHRSRGYLVQVFRLPNDVIRIAVNRTMITPETGDWLDKITWDTLQKIKSQLGYGDRDALEIYPAESDVVNVANIRHLFIIPKEMSEQLKFIWRR